MDEEVKPRGFLWSETTPSDTITMDTHHHTFVQTRRIHNTRSEAQGRLWTRGDGDMSVLVRQC